MDPDTVRLHNAYREAQRRGSHTFAFDGRVYVTAYVGHLLMFLAEQGIALDRDHLRTVEIEPIPASVNEE
jgi:hypothetical protein